LTCGYSGSFRLFVARLVAELLILYIDTDMLCGQDFRAEINRWLNPPRLIHGMFDIVLRMKLRLVYKRLRFNLSHHIKSEVLLMRNGEQLCITGCSMEAQHFKISRLENEIEHFSWNITQHIHHFHQCIFSIGSPILEISHLKSHDRLPSKVPG
jgi:hypothetical protein